VALRKEQREGLKRITAKNRSRGRKMRPSTNVANKTLGKEKK
jgi:hypothetical protein